MKNISVILSIVKKYLNGEISTLDFSLDIPYEIEKRYHKMLKEDSDYADMIYYYLIEEGTDYFEKLSMPGYEKRIKRSCKEVLDGVY